MLAGNEHPITEKSVYVCCNYFTTKTWKKSRKIRGGKPRCGLVFYRDKSTKRKTDMCECVCEKSKSESSQVGGSLIHEASFFEAVLSDVKDQVEFGCFDSGEKSEAECICKIIAEVSLLPSDALIRINKVQMQVQTVRDVYRLITHEHIVLCLEKFHQVNYEIRFIKNYFRTALYNAVLESDLHFRNKYEYDVFGGAK